MTTSALQQTMKGARPAQQKRSREKLVQMIKAGNRLIEQQGYERTKIADIAKAAGCSVGVFYERFKDKENFFKLLLQSNAQRSREALERFLAPEIWVDLPVSLLIDRLVKNNVAWFARHKGLYCAAMSAQFEQGQNFVPFQEQSIHQAECLIAVLKPRAHELDCEDVDAAVWFVVQLVGGVLVQAAFADAAQRAGSHNPSDQRLSFANPELSKQLARTAKLYLGVHEHAQGVHS